MRPNLLREKKPSTTKIALVSEGTYPYYTGGVSSWCHQIISGMPDYQFEIIPLSVNGLERSIWSLPANVSAVNSLPLWGFEPIHSNRRGQKSNDFDEAHLTFLKTLTHPKVGSSQRPASLDAAFLESLQALFHYAQNADLSAAMLSNRSVERLLDLWPSLAENPAAKMGKLPNLTVADALEVSSLLEHLLRPLSYPPPQVDLVHCAMNGLSTLVGMAAKWAYGTPLLMSEHGIYLRERYLSYLNETGPYPVKVLTLNFFRLLTSAAYRVSDIVAPHSRYNRRWALHNGAKASQLRIMYNGVDPNEFAPSETEVPDPILVFMGRIDPLKDLHTLIRALAIVRESVPEARLLAFGPVPEGNEGYFKSCQELIQKLGIEQAVSFMGRVKHPRDAYHAGQIVVLSSISEGFPYTVIEAMSSGRATVSTNVGGVSEGVGRAGIVVPPRDPKTMAAACVRLLLNPRLRKRLGMAARERVLHKFTLEQSIQAYRSNYLELLGDFAPTQEYLVQASTVGTYTRFQ